MTSNTRAIVTRDMPGDLLIWDGAARRLDNTGTAPSTNHLFTTNRQEGYDNGSQSHPTR